MLRKGCSLPDPGGGVKGEQKDKGQAIIFCHSEGTFSFLVALKLLLTGVRAVLARHLTGREEGGMARRASYSPVELVSALQVGCSPRHTPLPPSLQV